MKVAIIYYSTYGHVRQLAEAVKDGAVKSDAAAKVDIFQVAETLSEEVLQKMHAPAKALYPIATPEVLAEYDAFLFGVPTRFGNMPAQFKAFWDTTGGLWASGGLYGKPAGVFVSTGTPGGGQETTPMTFLTQLVHHGMSFVPLGYAPAFELLTNTDEVHGGSPWGAGSYAGGDGSRQPTRLELDTAVAQGSLFATTAAKLVGDAGETGKAAATEKGTAGSATTGAAAAEPEDKAEVPSDKPEAHSKAASDKPADKAAADKRTTAPAKPEHSAGCKCIIM